MAMTPSSFILLLGVISSPRWVTPSIRSVICGTVRGNVITMKGDLLTKVGNLFI